MNESLKIGHICTCCLLGLEYFSRTMKKSAIPGRLRLLFFLILTVLAGCQKSDEIVPSILSITINSESTEHPHTIAGQSFSIEISLEDNSDLGQVKVSMVALDGHIDPEEVVPLMFCPNIGEWPFLKILNLDGTNQDVVLDILCPDSIQGVWEVEVEVIDKAGNISSKSFPLHVQNDFLPYIGVNTLNAVPDENSVVHFNTGETLEVTGEALDQDGDILSSVFCKLERNSVLVWEQTWSPEFWSFDLSQIVIPAFTESGEYVFTIFITDNEDQQYWKTLNIQVE